MNTWSKIETVQCKDFSHPWTDSCALSGLYVFATSCVGSAAFCTGLYLYQYLTTVIKKKKRETAFKDFLKMHVRSTVFAASVTAGSFMAHCLLRNTIGKFYYYTAAFIPSCIGGLGIFIESRKGKELAFNAFANCCLELWIRLLEENKILKWGPNLKTFTFMALSSTLSFLLGSTNFKSNYFWFFMPPKIDKTDDEKVGNCFHTDPCWKHILKLLFMYSMTGFVLQYIRLMIKAPKLFLYSLTKRKNFTLAAFLGGYAALYQITRCYLYQKYKKYSSFHDSIAGFLAGIAFRFQPTIPIFNSAILAILQILGEIGNERKIIPNLPFLELIFAFFCGVLFHCRVFFGEKCPPMMVYITSAVTNKMSDYVASNYKNLVENFMKQSAKFLV